MPVTVEIDKIIIEESNLEISGIVLVICDERTEDAPRIVGGVIAILKELGSHQSTTKTSKRAN